MDRGGLSPHPPAFDWVYIIQGGLGFVLGTQGWTPPSSERLESCKLKVGLLTALGFVGDGVGDRPICRECSEQDLALQFSHLSLPAAAILYFVLMLSGPLARPLMRVAFDVMSLITANMHDGRKAGFTSHTGDDGWRHGMTLK